MSDYNINEDTKATFSTLHVRKMQSLVFNENEFDEKFKQFIPVSFSMKNNQLNVVGGICGWVSFDFSYIEAIWVEPSLRNSKRGKELVLAFEARIKLLHCNKVLVTTNSFTNAKAFWQKLGYDLFSELELEQCTIQYFQKSI